jgi:hypothetical protein
VSSINASEGGKVRIVDRFPWSIVHDRALLNLQYRPWYRRPPKQSPRIYVYANRNTNEVLPLCSKKCNLLYYSGRLRTVCVGTEHSGEQKLFRQDDSLVINLSKCHCHPLSTELSSHHRAMILIVDSTLQCTRVSRFWSTQHLFPSPCSTILSRGFRRSSPGSPSLQYLPEKSCK